MDKIKWGIIGTGRIAVLFAEALAGTADAELYAVASRTKDKAEDFAAKYGFEKAYGSYRELAEDGGVDIVYIATPMSSHYGDAKLCLENGKNVLCEKTLTLNTSQSEEIISLAKERGLFFMEAMWMKFRPTFLKALEWVRSGAIGKLQYVKADFCNFMPYNPEDRTFRADCGGGALLDLGVYPITFAAHFLGYEPKEIVSAAHIGVEGVDMSNTVLLKYDGCFASLNSSFEVQCRNKALISGEKGSIIIGDWFHCSSEAELFDIYGNSLERSVIPVDVNGYEYEIYESHRCLREGLLESELCTHAETLAVMRIMDECRRQWGMTYEGE